MIGMPAMVLWMALMNSGRFTSEEPCLAKDSDGLLAVAAGEHDLVAISLQRLGGCEVAASAVGEPVEGQADHAAVERAACERTAESGPTGDLLDGPHAAADDRYPLHREVGVSEGIHRGDGRPVRAGGKQRFAAGRAGGGLGGEGVGGHGMSPSCERISTGLCAESPWRDIGIADCAIAPRCRAPPAGGVLDRPRVDRALHALTEPPRRRCHSSSSSKKSYGTSSQAARSSRRTS